MKYMVNSQKKAPVVKQVAPFDMAATLEALSASIEAAGIAYGEMVAAEGRIAEVEMVLSDLSDAKASIEKYGIAVENMALINKGDNLTECLGLESLALDAIETLSADTKKMLQSQYVASLEGQVGEMIKAAIARIKEFFAKVASWLAKVFDVNAKLAKVCQELKFEGEFNADYEAKVLSFEDAKAGIEALKKAVEDLDKAKKDESFEVTPVKLAESVKGKVGEKGYTAENVAQLRDMFIKEVGSVAKFNATWKELSAEGKKAQSEGGEDQSVLDKLNAALKKWQKARSITGGYASAFRTIAFTIIGVGRAFKKEAPAKEPEAK